MSSNMGHGLGRGSPFSSASSKRGRGGRAGYASRGGRSGRGGSWQNPRSQNVPDTSLHPLGELLASLDNSVLDPAALSSATTPSITDCQYVTSYNWLNEENPTILVPGKPPLWIPLDVPRPLNEDRGNYFRDPNAARFPSYPSEPAVQALLNTNPQFPMSSIDIFACGSTMGNLLRFVRSIDKPFRFSVEAINNTVFFIRKENKPDELIDGVFGYGHTFPESYTTWEKEAKGSETHQRVVQYHFAGLKCLVRFECDGYLGGSTNKNASTNSGPSTNSNGEDIADIFGGVSVSQHPSTTSNLNLKNGGSMVPQESIFDLKTRSGRYGKQINMEDQLPSLWIKQIPNFVVAYHNGAGLFEKDKIHVRNVRGDIQRWETENTAALKRMAALIRKIVDLAKSNDDHRIDVYCPSVNRLEIRKQRKGGSRVLPSSLRKKWAAEQPFSFNASPKKYSDSGEEKKDDDDRRHKTQLKDHHGLGNWSGSKSDDSGVDFDTLYAQLDMEKYSSPYEEEPDYTACSAEGCGYCGRCHYD